MPRSYDLSADTVDRIVAVLNEGGSRPDVDRSEWIAAHRAISPLFGAGQGRNITEAQLGQVNIVVRGACSIDEDARIIVDFGLRRRGLSRLLKSLQEQ